MYKTEEALKELNETTDKKLYKYNGPTFRFGRFQKNLNIETEAISREQGINNLKYKAKTELHLPSNARIEIDEEKVIEIPLEKEPKPKKETKPKIEDDFIQLSMF